MTPLPFVDLQAQYRRIKDAVDARIHKVLDHGKYILGPEIVELEEALNKFCGARHCITVSSGTEALRIPMMAEGIGVGDAVFMPAFTFTATAEVPVAQGATPVFVDVAENSFNIDLNSLATAIATVKREGKLRPRAVVAVDLFGLPADYEQLAELCRRENLFLLADAAQSFGAMSGNRSVGTLAPVTATSFFPAKPLGCYGDGGAIFTDDAAQAEAYRSIRMHGAGGDRYDIIRIGTNGRLDTMQAAVLLVKLDIFADELKARERVAKAYDQRLDRSITRPPRQSGMLSAWAQYCILLNRRDEVVKKLGAGGIPTAIYYPRPMHMQTAYAQYGSGTGSLPVSERLSQRILALPMHPYLDEATLERICTAVNAAVTSG
jgi:UDP-2-acetamido-2-deoxy-ribo-hexuluronate aminotransferase